MLKGQSGITLVALVITIIILIILAAVSISTIMNTNLFGLAVGAANNYAQAGAEENKQLESMMDTIGQIDSMLRDMYPATGS